MEALTYLMPRATELPESGVHKTPVSALTVLN
jgi:hypothetical protein